MNRHANLLQSAQWDFYLCYQRNSPGYFVSKCFLLNHSKDCNQHSRLFQICSSEIENIPLFSAPSTFKYTIEKKPITKEDEVEFTFKVNENLAEDSSLDTSLSLVEIPNYVKGINNFLDINKPIKVDRDGVPVINFYNLNNPFYRLFGEYWRPDNDIPGSCEWFSTSVFPKPVIVDKDHKNGIS